MGRSVICLYLLNEVKKLMIKLSLLLVLLVATSCAGYSMQSRTNPFSQYGIRTIHIPMFYNQSSLANVGSVFTKEVTKVLSGFKNLKLSQGYNNSDAVLIGIVTSSKKLREAVRTKSSNRVVNIFGEDAIGDKRQDFQIPSRNSIDLALRIIVIKHPSESEIKFLQSSLGQKVKNSKIIFNEVISATEDYTLKELEPESIQVLGSQNMGLQREAKKALAVKVSRSFKDMILYAF